MSYTDEEVDVDLIEAILLAAARLTVEGRARVRAVLEDAFALGYETAQEEVADWYKPA